MPPPIGLFIHEYQARNIVYGVTAALQTFFYSNQEFTGFGSPPESFAPLNQVTLPISGAKINGMASLPTGLVIWSDKRDMFKLTGVLVDNNVTTDVNIGSSIQRLPYDLGCVSPYATAVTPLGVFWVTSDLEVRLFTDNHAPRNIGRKGIGLKTGGEQIGRFAHDPMKRGFAQRRHVDLPVRPKQRCILLQLTEEVRPQAHQDAQATIGKAGCNDLRETHCQILKSRRGRHAE